MSGGNGRGENAEFATVAGGRDEILAPIAENVSTQARVGLAPVDRAAVVSPRIEKRSLATVLPVPFGDGDAVEQFAERIGVPPDAHIAGAGRCSGDPHAFYVV